MLFEATKSVLIRYGSPRKLVQGRVLGSLALLLLSPWSKASPHSVFSDICTLQKSDVTRVKKTGAQTVTCGC